MKVWRVVRRFLAVLGVTLFAVVVAFFAAVTRGNCALYASSFAATSSATSMTLSIS